MSSNSRSIEDGFFSEQPLDSRGAEFFERVRGMLDGRPRDATEVEAALSGWDGLLEKIAAELYRISSMLLGEGEQAIHLIETVIARLDIPSFRDPADARHRASAALAADAIAILAERDPTALAARGDDSGPASCIEDDDLSAAGVTAAELEQMLSGPDNHRLRAWLEGLSVPLRVIFVLRAVAGLSSGEVAGILAEDGGPAAQDWTPDSVRSGFRQALCSLASQLLHASTAH